MDAVKDRDDCFKLMIGVGVNLNTLAYNYDKLSIASSVLIETGVRIPMEDFTKSFTENLVRFYDNL